MAAERELELNGQASSEDAPLTAEQLEEAAQEEIRDRLKAEDDACSEGFVCPLFKVKIIIDQQWLDEYDRTGKFKKAIDRNFRNPNRMHLSNSTRLH